MPSRKRGRRKLKCSSSSSESCRVKVKCRRETSESCRKPRRVIKVKCVEKSCSSSEQACGCKGKCKCHKVCIKIDLRFSSPLAIASTTPPTVGAVPGTAALAGTPTVDAFVTAVGCG